jgi:hypothetical protein
MDPVIFEFLGGVLVGGMAGLMVVLRNRHSLPETMPMLAIRSPRSASSDRRQRNPQPTEKGHSTGAVARKRKKAKNKNPTATAASSQTPVIASATVSFDTCPSCGLQAPGSLLTEHFLGSPSHRNGIPKIVEADPVDLEAAKDAKEEESKQSVRNLLQMLVPPRAFGRRHAYRSVSPISPIIKNSGPTAGRTNRL